VFHLSHPSPQFGHWEITTPPHSRQADGSKSKSANDSLNVQTFRHFGFRQMAVGISETDSIPNDGRAWLSIFPGFRTIFSPSQPTVLGPFRTIFARR
jgi:hypothetical protein